MPKSEQTTLLWFRRDLRLADNPALHAALGSQRLLPVYIDAPGEADTWAPGAASRWWLHHSLVALDRDLRALGSGLVIRRGESSGAVLDGLIRESGADWVVWNRCYERWAFARDRAVKGELRDRGVRAQSFNSALLHEPWSLLKADGTPFRVFAPFWKAALREGVDQAVLPPPNVLPPVPDGLASDPVDSLGLLPEIPWDRGFYPCWEPGETGAWKAATSFFEGALPGYSAQRDEPGRPATSRLSPHLHFGEIGPRQLIRALLEVTGAALEPTGNTSSARFAAELGWREFANHLLYHFPETRDRPLDARFEPFPWAEGYADHLVAWQRGRTGIPLVDAGMRQLWETGWMHNRVRMIVASFLAKNLLIPWQEGARWFWDTLVDADLANNTLGWQWTAGCGADAAPYFRVFNPVLQGERFDPDGVYVRSWVPELARLPSQWLHRPWDADAGSLDAAGLRLGQTYPRPIVNLKATRERALARFQALKRGRG